jgi:hypothetical protein
MKVAARIALTASLAGSAGVAFGGGAASATTISGTSAATPYGCSVVTPKGTFSASVSASFSGTTPASVAVGATVKIAGFQAEVSIPGSVLDDAYEEGVRSVAAGVSAFNITSTDATTPTVNVVKNLVNVGSMKLQASNNATLNVSIPRKAATVGGWVASQAGTMTFTPGNATFEFKTKAGSLSVQCTPSSPASISTTTVS